jgi:acetyl esterase
MVAPTLNVQLPGRLGDATLQLRSDPRADPRMIKAFAPFGIDVTAPPLPIDRRSPIEDLHAVAAAIEQAFAGMFGALLDGVPRPEGIERHTETITGADGNDITLYVDRPVGAQGPLPGLLHLHGGGMAISQAADGPPSFWRGMLAARGSVVVGVEYRNSAGVLGLHPFPAGLNDCVSALDWMHAVARTSGSRRSSSPVSPAAPI